MRKKYIAWDYSYLGQTCDTKEQAERAARGMEYYVDAKTGYSAAYNCDPLSSADVTEIEDRQVSTEEYLRSIEDEKIAKKKFKKKVERLKKKMLGKFETIRVAYINTNTLYSKGDKISLITRRASGRKRKIEDRVCGVKVLKNGEIRPDIYDKDYPDDEEILSIEVLEHFDYQKVNRRVVCRNCVHFKPTEPHGYCLGYCDKHNRDLYHSVENQSCYINEPDKYKGKRH